LHDLYQEAATPWEWHPRLKGIAAELGLDFFSTPFDEKAIEFLEEQEAPLYKVASFEIVDLPLIRRIAATGKPMILSTGMSELSEIAEAVEAARGAGAREIALLKCTSVYPAPPGEINLRTIPQLAAEFEVPVGLSDHTHGTAVATAAVALGASIVEKHLTFSRTDKTADSAFSLEPDEFRAMVDAIRTTETAMGEVRFGPSPSEAGSRIFRRSLFAVDDIEQGAALSRGNVRSIRPGYGLPPKYLERILGRRAARRIPRGTPLTWELIEGGESGQA
jgi:N-acetylneuraminate synthase